VQFGEGLAGRIVSADRERLEVAIGPGARATYRWARLTPGHFLSLMNRITLRGEHVLAGAELFLELGDRERALAFLASRYEASPELRQRLWPLVAEARDMELPTSGFQLLDGAFLTEEEKVVALREREI
jgi:hypothetical protein